MNGHDPEQNENNKRTAAVASRALFERSVERLDVGTANRLRLARRDALNSPASIGAPRAWTAAVAASALLALGLAWWLPRSTTHSTGAAPAVVSVPAVSPQASADATDVALSADDDADLYAWLGDAPVAVDPPEGESL
jgi:hypothetical protein